MTVQLTFLASGLVLLLTVLACGGGSDPSPSPSAASPSQTMEPPVATGSLLTDYGVTDDEIRLGHVAGDGALGQAIAAYFAYQNSEGGVCGRNITLLEGRSAAEAQALIEEDEVAAFAGNTTEPLIRQMIDDAQVPELFAVTGDEPSAFPWSIAFGPGGVAEGAALAGYIDASFPDQTVGTLYQESELETRAAFVRATGAEVVAQESYASTQTDIDEQLDAVRAADPDVFVLFSSTEYTALAYQYMTENDWHPQVVMSNGADALELAEAVGGDVIAGAITAAYLADPLGDAPSVAEHTRIMAEYDGSPVSKDSLYAQAIAETMIQTLDIACEDGDMTRAGILKAALEVEDFHPTTLLEGVNVMLGPSDQMAIETLLPVVIQKDGTLAPFSTEAPTPLPSAS